MFYDGNGYEFLMEIKMPKVSKKAVAEKKAMIATIYNRSVVTKSEARAESEDAITKFLQAGGVIQECKPSRRGAKAGRKMSGKTSRGFQSGTGGFATGFPRGSAGFSK